MMRSIKPINRRYIPVSDDTSAGIYDAGNKTLVISPDECTPELAGRKFACRTTENGRYESFSSDQVMTLSCEYDFKSCSCLFKKFSGFPPGLT
jgi:hypothetical protein